MASCPTYSDVFLSPECSSADGLAAVIASASCSPLYQGMDDSPAPANCHNKRFYNSMFEEDGGDEEMSDEVATHQVEKKRRLSVEQVKALEKNFEIENKLEPERKIQLARELGLQPRQVAVWFQNRRARWKTKQLEKDYDVLKSEYDDLKNGYMDLAKEKDSLQAEVARLRERLAEGGTRETTDSTVRVKVEENNNLLVEGYTAPAANYSEAQALINSQQALESHAGAACKKEGSLSSDSDASEVVEVESPRRCLRLYDSSQDHHSPSGSGAARGGGGGGAAIVGVMNHMMSAEHATASFTPQFMLHDSTATTTDVSYVCKGLFPPGSFETLPRTLLKVENEDDEQQHRYQQQFQVEDHQQAPQFAWSWDPWA